MELHLTISKLRNEAGLTQAQFAEIFGVSQQSVQKWESGLTVPDMEKIVAISKYFDISLDALILGNDNRIVEEMGKSRNVQPQYETLADWQFYSSNLMTEYRQSVEEGLDIEQYREVFSAVSMLPKNEIKKKFGDVLFEIVMSAKQKEGYPYIEPSELEKIRELRRPAAPIGEYNKQTLADQIHGAWMGRICGCMLGQCIEGIRTNELIPFLKETNNYPLHRYICRSDLNEATLAKYKFAFAGKRYVDELDAMPGDDDTNYTVINQEVIEHFGKDFVPQNVARTWLSLQGKSNYATAERVAYCNFINGFVPPDSAVYKNAFREWIGAQIRGDYFGYINPGNPEMAAEMAWRDASISHVKNGIYGEMFVAAMLAVAATTTDMENIVLGGLAEIPYTSRLYESVMKIVDAFRAGTTAEECFKMIHTIYDERNAYDWCHTISNAMIVVAALLYGRGDYGKSVCMAVETGFDTDCNGATVGSIVGMAYGIHHIPEYWTKPFHDTLHTGCVRLDTLRISDRVALTLKHIESK